AGTFVNTGRFHNNGATAHTVSPTTFRNNGGLQVLGGSLTFTSSGTHSGTFDVAAGTALGFSGSPNTFIAGSRLQGAGAIAFGGGNHVLQAGAVYTGV